MDLKKKCSIKFLYMIDNLINLLKDGKWINSYQIELQSHQKDENSQWWNCELNSWHYSTQDHYLSSYAKWPWHLMNAAALHNDMPQLAAKLKRQWSMSHITSARPSLWQRRFHRWRGAQMLLTESLARRVTKEGDANLRKLRLLLNFD